MATLALIIGAITLTGIALNTFYVERLHPQAKTPEISEGAKKWANRLEASLKTGVEKLDVKTRHVVFYLSGKGKSTFLPSDAVSSVSALYKALIDRAPVAREAIDSEARRTILENCLTLV